MQTALKEILVYVADYICFKYGYSNSDDGLFGDTYFEYNAHRAFLDTINRGSLTIPPDSLVHFVYYTVMSFLCLRSASETYPCANALLACSKVVCDTYGFLRCDSVMQQKITRSICNIILNNFTHTVQVPGGKESIVKLAKL